MKIEIVCRNEIYCDLMKARVEKALDDLHLSADVEFVMDHASQEALETDSKTGLVIDGQMIAIGTGHSIADIRRLLELQGPTKH